MSPADAASLLNNLMLTFVGCSAALLVLKTVTAYRDVR